MEKIFLNQPLLDSAQILTDELMEQIENGDKVACGSGCQRSCKKNCESDGRGTTIIEGGDFIIGADDKLDSKAQ